jgi:hypothetical protein
VTDKPVIIGVDFDNTIVTYDELLHTIAVKRGLISLTVEKNKRHIRDTIRRLPDGEIEWQKLQALVYGPFIKEAKLTEGVSEFFQLCRRKEIKTYIISHKTEYSRYDETHTNLRTAALAWMSSRGFFERAGLGLSPQDVFFNTSRSDKVARIHELLCTHFIDDLEETFLELSFPAAVKKILYAPLGSQVELPDVKLVTTWQEIRDYFFQSES